MPSQSFSLVLRSGPNAGQVFELNKSELYIGRDVSNDIVINDAEVSRKHARLVLQAGGYVLEDLGSTNGSFAGGQRLMGPHILRPGELIMFGETVSLSYEAGYDENATLVAAPGAPPTQAPAPSRRQARQPRPAPQQTYTNQIPPSPPEAYYGEQGATEKKSDKTMLWVGCGCLVVLLCVVVGGAIAFDMMNLYCTPPFNILFSCP